MLFLTPFLLACVDEPPMHDDSLVVASVDTGLDGFDDTGLEVTATPTPTPDPVCPGAALDFEGPEGLAVSVVAPFRPGQLFGDGAVCDVSCDVPWLTAWTEPLDGSCQGPADELPVEGDSDLCAAVLFDPGPAGQVGTCVVEHSDGPTTVTVTWSP